MHIQRINKMKDKMEKMKMRKKLINNLWKINKNHRIIRNKNIQMMMKIIILINCYKNKNNKNKIYLKQNHQKQNP